MNHKITVHSPGRINLIGEHVDYNGGHVLPASIDKKITMNFEAVECDDILIHTLDYDQLLKIEIGNYRPSSQEWENYILGVLFYVDKLRPQRIKGLKCTITSSLPPGSGLSSSAALSCGFASGINRLFNLELTDNEIMESARNAEHHFVGTKCGVMDQFAVVKGKKDHLILLNTSNNEFEYIPAKFSPYKIVLLNTNISHNLASSEYNQRREACESALEMVNRKGANYQYLCDVPLERFNSMRNQIADDIFIKAKFVIKENWRTIQAAELLKEQDFSSFGKLMYASHTGLSKEYEVSCPELDFLVEFTRGKQKVLGSRMMGGGFGGCTINLVQDDYVDQFIRNASREYKKQFNIDLTPITTVIHNGVTIS